MRKSEYYKVRKLYYEALTKSDREYQSENFDMNLSQLYEGEIIGARAEDLRQCFRMSYGILDKIAVSICDYDFPVGAKENIYFHGFWRDKNRWDKVNETDKSSSFALYFQATDLNSDAGQWKEFKN
ncbi:LA2681 family HEPN domain-containing protein [Bdellovibrio bacteriovorus]|uniref:LA2681 family HEPN domain-containing protein n=1 Tax=Bdellovibrio bacteriovorus TaxID=959 RepID=UPI0035A59574